MPQKPKCPLCGQETELQPHPTQPGRLILACPCHPQGPVLETDAPLPVTKKESEKPQ
jgi:hypothetical protein